MNNTKMIGAIMTIAIAGLVATNAVAKDRTTDRNTGYLGDRCLRR